MPQDYKNSLILGFIIGLFLIPTEINLGISSKIPVFYLASIIGFMVLAFLGLWIAKLLVVRVPILWQFAKFGLVGVGNTAINFGIVNVLVLITGVNKGWPVYFFAALAFAGALMNSYIWNSHWSFKEHSAPQRTTKEFIEFFLVTFIGLQINSIIVYAITTHVAPIGNISPQRWVNVANVIATLAVMFWDFGGFKYIVFRGEQKKA